MAGSNFVDHVRICCRSGKGGAGSKHLFRDRLNAKGGPDGGDGGRGGHVIIRGNSQFLREALNVYIQSAGADDIGGVEIHIAIGGKGIRICTISIEEFALIVPPGHREG